MGKQNERRKEKKGVPDDGKVGTGGVVTLAGAVPLGLGRNTFRCFLANPGGSSLKSKPGVVHGAIDISIWPTRSRARIELSNSLVEREVIGASAGGVDDIVMKCLPRSWS